MLILSVRVKVIYLQFLIILSSSREEDPISRGKRRAVGKLADYETLNLQMDRFVSLIGLYLYGIIIGLFN